MTDQRRKHPEPALGQQPHLSLVEQADAAKPKFATSLGPSAPSSVSASISIACANGIAGSLPEGRSSSPSGAADQSPAVRVGKAPQIVEAKLRRATSPSSADVCRFR